jgi:hypothetical protein
VIGTSLGVISTILSKIIFIRTDICSNLVSLSSIFEIYAWGSYNVFLYYTYGAYLTNFRVLQSVANISLSIKISILGFLMHYLFNIIFVSYISWRNGKDPEF